MAHKKTPRSIRYTWSENSHISRLDAKMDDDGFYVVQLFPGKGEAEGALGKVPSQLRRYGFKDPYPDVKDGQSVLALANVKSLDKLIGALGSGQFVSGAPTIEAINGHNETISEAQRRKEEKKFDTVKAHGYVGMVGHAGIFINGLIQKPFDWGRLLNAPLGAANPILMSWLGSGKDNVDVPELMRDMRSFFAQEGINLPYMTGEDQYRGFLETTKHFLMAHPIEVGSALGATGSVAMIGSGWKQWRSGGGGFSRVLLGLVNITRDGIAIFVPEKEKKDSEVSKLQGGWVDSVTAFPGKAAHLATHPKEIPGAAWNLVSGFPLFMVGALSMVSDVLFGVDAADAFQKNKMFRHQAYESGGEFERRKWFGLGKKETINFEKEYSTQAKNLSRQAKEQGYRENIAEVLKLKDNYLSTGSGADFDSWNKAHTANERLNQEAISMRKNQNMANSWRGQATPWLNLVPAVAFLGAAIFMMQSSKHHKKNEVGHEALLSRLYSINAKILTVVPEGEREQVLGRLTDYFRTRKDVGDKFDADKFKQEVRSRINQMQHSPWIERVGVQAAANNNRVVSAVA